MVQRGISQKDPGRFAELRTRLSESEETKAHRNLRLEHYRGQTYRPGVGRVELESKRERLTKDPEH